MGACTAVPVRQRIGEISMVAGKEISSTEPHILAPGKSLPPGAYEAEFHAFLFHAGENAQRNRGSNRTANSHPGMNVPPGNKTNVAMMTNQPWTGQASGLRVHQVLRE